MRIKRQSNVLMMDNWILLRCLLTIALFVCLDSKSITKRQLYREQVVPGLGGKVPDSAFSIDRLALNQLNARGIYTSTGTYLEHRETKEFPQTAAIRVRQPHTMQVQIPYEHRFVAPEGRFHFRSPASVDTTYVIRDPVLRAFDVSTTHHYDQRALPLVPHHSLQLAQHFRDAAAAHRHRQWDAQHNDIEALDDFSKNADTQYLPYLKTLHELDK